MFEIALRPAEEKDLDAIDEIEQHSFKSPWSRDTFAQELTREWARLDVACNAAAGGRVVGFCNYWLVTTAGAQRRDQDDKQAADGGELHILAIATHPDVRNRGIGRHLVDHMLEAARATGCSLATLEVRRSNRPAIALYERVGFKTVHVRARYYRDDEDALVMLRGIS